MFWWPKRMLGRRSPAAPITVLDENGDEEQDELLCEVLNRAFHSGGPVFANRNDDGTVTISDDSGTETIADPEGTQ